MANFATYLPLLFANEGGYCDYYPSDSGGETFRGIARRPNPNWPGWASVDAVKAQLGLTSPVPPAHWPALDNSLLANAELGAAINSFYEAAYWSPLRLDEVLSQSIADQLADHGVNAGIRRTSLMLQYLLNTEFGASLAVDGEVGALTIMALNSTTPPLFYLRLVEMRRAFYTYLADGAAIPGTENWASFFHQIGLVPNPRMQQFLNAWLTRTQRPFSS